jgi:hypothetical protein
MATIKIADERGYSDYSEVLEDGAVLDLRGAIFRTEQKPEKKNLYPINLRGGRNVRVVGGLVYGSTPADIGWGERYSGANSAAINFGNYKQPNDLMAGGIVEQMRLYNVWDGFRPACAPGFVIQDNWVTHLADDCLENDQHQPGTFQRNLLDGVFVAFSSRNSGAKHDGSRAEVLIKDNLIRMGLFPGWPGKRHELGPACGDVFKWERQGTRVRVIGNTFWFADSPRTQYGTRTDPFGDELGFGAIWAEIVLESRDNLIIWIGEGEYPWPVPDGFRVIRDAAVWQQKKLAWIAAHPEITRVTGDPTVEPPPPPPPPPVSDLRKQVLELVKVTARLEQLTR